MRFGDTDAAGVMHFHQLLRWCHEAWEDSLTRYGITVAEVFPGCRDQNLVPSSALPVVHCEADFLRPIHGGDQLIVQLTTKRLDPSSFEVIYRFLLEETDVARGVIRHVAISPAERRRCPLPAAIDRWLEASSLGQLRPI